jgi:hypothetical protein
MEKLFEAAKSRLRRRMMDEANKMFFEDLDPWVQEG